MFTTAHQAPASPSGLNHDLCPWREPEREVLIESQKAVLGHMWFGLRQLRHVLSTLQCRMAFVFLSIT